MIRSFLTPAVAALLVAGLGGCVSMSRSGVRDPLPADWAANSHVESIVLHRPGGLKVSDGFDDLFKSRVKAKLDACAAGSRPLRLEADITRLKKSNKAATVVLGGGANVIRGSARLIDVQSGREVGDYKIGRTVIGTRLATIQMLEAEEQLSDGYGEELCKRAFVKPG